MPRPAAWRVGKMPGTPSRWSDALASLKAAACDLISSLQLAQPHALSAFRHHCQENVGVRTRTVLTLIGVVERIDQARNVLLAPLGGALADQRRRHLPPDPLGDDGEFRAG